MRILSPIDKVGSKMMPFALLLWISESISASVFPFERMIFAPIAAVPTFAINA